MRSCGLVRIILGKNKLAVDSPFSPGRQMKASRAVGVNVGT